MPRRLDRSLSAAVAGELGPILAGLTMLAGSMLIPATAQAEGGYARPAPSPYGYRPPPGPRRCGPPRPCQAGPYDGRSGVVHAYLPRNNAVPMYNEPPPRFPGN